jgi:AraC-like DNA-binding protein
MPGMSSALHIAHGAFGRVALLDMDRSLVRHAHPHCHVLIKARGADTRFAVGSDLVALTDTQAVLVNAWEPDAYVHDMRRPRTVILALYIEPAWLETFRPNWRASRDVGFFARPAGELSVPIRRIAHDLAGLMLEEPGATAAQEELLSALMIAVIERFTPWRSVAPAPGRAPLDWRIRRAIRRLATDAGAVPDTAALARQAGLSRAHLYRLFGRATPASPHVYLNMLRLECAVSAIVADDGRLAAVSERLGFRAPAHFSRFFRDHAGVTPSEFRAAARAGAAGT